MNVKVRQVEIESGKTDQVFSDVQHAMLSLDEDGFRVVSVVPITQFGDTTIILVCGIKSDRS